MEGYYGLTLWMKNCLTGFKLAGWDDVAILKEAGVSADTLAAGYCSFDTYNQIFSAAEALYGSSACVVSRFGMLPNSFQSLSLAMLSTGSFFEALTLNVKYGKSMSNGVDWFVEDGESVVFGFKPYSDQEVSPAVAIAILTMMVKTARFLNPGRDVIRFVELGHTQGDIQSCKPVIDYFRVPIRWGGEQYAVHYCADVVKEPSITANHELMLKCERNWLDEVAGYQDSSFLLKSHAFVRANVSEESLGIEALAKDLGMSIRTLQRRFRNESTSFKAIVESVRKEEALRLVRRPETSISEAAYYLGFSDAGNFSRAFRRWFDCSPEQYRREHLSVKIPNMSLEI